MIEDAQIVLYLGFAFTLFYTCFCRMAIMSRRSTRRDIRWAFTVMGIASILALVAPLWGYKPDGIVTMLLGSFACVQVATSYHWRHGLPAQYHHEPPDCSKCIRGRA